MPEYFTLAELRALPDVSDTSAYPDATVEAAAARVVSIIERECWQTSFISRTISGELHDGLDGDIFLNKFWVLSVTSATENGVTVTDTLRHKNGQVLRFATGSYLPRGWLPGVQNIAVTYVAGYSATPPADIKDAALQATRYRLLSRSANVSMNDRATSITNEFGNVNLSVASSATPFGIPEVDSVIVGYRNLLTPVLA